MPRWHASHGGWQTRDRIHAWAAAADVNEFATAGSIPDPVPAEEAVQNHVVSEGKAGRDDVSTGPVRAGMTDGLREFSHGSYQAG